MTPNARDQFRVVAGMAQTTRSDGDVRVGIASTEIVRVDGVEEWQKSNDIQLPRQKDDEVADGGRAIE